MHRHADAAQHIVDRFLYGHAMKTWNFSGWDLEIAVETARSARREVEAAVAEGDLEYVPGQIAFSLYWDLQPVGSVPLGFDTRVAVSELETFMLKSVRPDAPPSPAT